MFLEFLGYFLIIMAIIRQFFLEITQGRKAGWFVCLVNDAVFCGVIVFGVWLIER